MIERTDFRDYTRALYAVISSPAGERDWDRVRPLYHPDARLVRTGINDDGAPFALAMTLPEYIENVEALLANVSFTEQELHHEARIFGQVAQLASTYAFTWESPTERREGRGMNFFTLVHADHRWQITSIVWDNERPEQMGSE